MKTHARVKVTSPSAMSPYVVSPGTISPSGKVFTRSVTQGCRRGSQRGSRREKMIAILNVR